MHWRVKEVYFLHRDYMFWVLTWEGISTILQERMRDSHHIRSIELFHTFVKMYGKHSRKYFNLGSFMKDTRILYFNNARKKNNTISNYWKKIKTQNFGFCIQLTESILCSPIFWFNYSVKSFVKLSTSFAHDLPLAPSSASRLNSTQFGWFLLQLRNKSLNLKSSMMRYLKQTQCNNGDREVLLNSLFSQGFL